MPTSIRIETPVVGRDSVTFRWSVDPPTELYTRTEFTITFPESVDVAALPETLWWTVAFLCLHPHWMLLRPCRVEIPVRLGAGVAETWLRLTDVGIATLESLRGGSATQRRIDIVEGDRELPTPVALPDRGRCATAFSGGKDSLLQAALLAELTVDPLLVATTSPMAPFHDHVSERRGVVFREIVRRRPVTFVEVATDARSMMFNSFPGTAAGYPLSVSELSDAFLYFSNLLVVAIAHGATHLFVASEAEVQENSLVDGRLVQHPHFMYSVVTQRAISALIAPLGVRYSTLTAPLHADSVQRLLWTRYRDLADLQYSCWNVPPGKSACSACTQCLRIALTAVAADDDPQRMGVELADVFVANAAWQPRDLALAAAPTDRVRAIVHAHIVENLRTLSSERVLRLITHDDPAKLEAPHTREALLAFQTLRSRAQARPQTSIGWRPLALDAVDELLRDRVAAIYAGAFVAESESEYRGVVERGRATAAWIVEPLTAGAVADEPRRLPVVTAMELRDGDDDDVTALLPAGDPTMSEAMGPLIRVSAPSLDGNEMRYVEEAVRSGWISSGGPFVGAFEKRFAELTQCAHAIACSSGTTALHLSLAALGIGPGDEVIVPTFTMIATPNAVAYTGATPVFVDADPLTWNIDPAGVAAAVTVRTRAIVVVHTYGAPADMDALRAIADARGLALVEDAAEAHGAAYRGRAVGSLGDVAAFSFYANKIVTTGEGGMVTTNDERFARVARRLRDHAFSEDRHFWHRYRGFNYRMTNLQAAVGVAQLERYAKLIGARRILAARYTAGLHDLAGLSFPTESRDTTHAFWMYTLVVGDAFGMSRDSLRAHLAAAGIETRTFFIPGHMQPIYRDGERGRRYPVSESLCVRGLYLPTAPGLTDAQIARVIAAVRSAANASQA